MKKLVRLYHFIISTIIYFICNIAIANCSITGADSLSFGSYNPLDSSDNISQSNITIDCSGRRSFTVKLSTGSSADYSQRKLYNNSNPLNYNIYLDTGFTSIWGDGTNNTNFYSNTNRGTDVIIAYGKIPAQQNISQGTYSDSIIVTLEF